MMTIISRRNGSSESGQALIEFGLIAVVLLGLTVGLVDVGRALFAYNGMAAAARYGARWGSVVGAECSGLNAGTSTSDWCTQLGVNTTNPFWNQYGNRPLQPTTPFASSQCPSTFPAPNAATFPASNFYTLSDPAFSATSTTIVGSIKQHFDTNGQSSNYIQGAFTPGFDLSQFRVCIMLTRATSGGSTTWEGAPGDTVTVFVYYPFARVSGLISKVGFQALVASSSYKIEG